MMDFFEEMSRTQDIVIETAKTLLLMERDGNRTIPIADRAIGSLAYDFMNMISTESMRQAAIAMTAEEICAKKRTSVTDFFNHIATANDDADLSLLEKAVFDIATLVVGGRDEALSLFEVLGPMSQDVLEECGEYAGGF